MKAENTISEEQKALLESHHADILLKTNSKIKHELVLESILSYL